MTVHGRRCITACRSRRRASVIACTLALAIACFAGAASAALPRPLARAFLDAGIPLDAVAVVVQEVHAPAALVSHHVRRPMAVASVMKLLTTYVALSTLGRDYRWRTEAYLDGPLRNGVLDGNLVLKGFGDPKITLEQWHALIASLRAAGLAAVDGDLVLDRSHFLVPPADPAAFDNAPQKPYNVGPDALLVSFKSVRFTFAPTSDGTATVALDPPLPAVHLEASPRLEAGECGDWWSALAPSIVDRGHEVDVSFDGAYPAACGERTKYLALLDAPSFAHAMFTTYFRAAGGRFDGGWREGRAPRDAEPFATLLSPPLYDIVRDVNKLSNNVMARQLFLTLAMTAYPPPATPAHAEAAVRRWLARNRLAMPGLVLDNGSGLSRSERIDAGSLARLLLAADASPVREEFASSLAVAATDGTVENRFRTTPAAGQALLKTGTLDRVRAIAGYVLDGTERRWAVVAIVNHANAARARPALDAVVEWVRSDAAAWPTFTGKAVR